MPEQVRKSRHFREVYQTSKFERNLTDRTSLLIGLSDCRSNNLARGGCNYAACARPYGKRKPTPTVLAPLNHAPTTAFKTGSARISISFGRFLTSLNAGMCEFVLHMYTSPQCIRTNRTLHTAHASNPVMCRSLRLVLLILGRKKIHIASSLPLMHEDNTFPPDQSQLYENVPNPIIEER
ncbi:hypothetical protein Tcan_00637, partial [Toxocara canis]